MIKLTTEQMENVDIAVDLRKKTIAYVISHREEIKQKYGNNYLAVINNEGVIDSDANEEKLIRRVYERGEVIADNVLFGSLEDLIEEDNLIGITGGSSLRK